MHGVERPAAHACDRLPALGEVGEAVIGHVGWGLRHFVDIPNGGVSFCCTLFPSNGRDKLATVLTFTR